MLAFEKNNSESVYQAMLNLSKSSKNQPSRDELLKKTSEVLRMRNENRDFLLDLVKAYTEAGIILEDRFFTGFFKGFVTLVGENYVTQEEFAQILQKEIKNHLKSKPLVAARLLINEKLKPKPTKPVVGLCSKVHMAH